MQGKSPSKSLCSVLSSHQKFKTVSLPRTYLRLPLKLGRIWRTTTMFCSRDRCMRISTIFAWSGRSKSDPDVLTSIAWLLFIKMFIFIGKLHFVWSRIFLFSPSTLWLFVLSIWINPLNEYCLLYYWLQERVVNTIHSLTNRILIVYNMTNNKAEPIFSSLEESSSSF